MKLPPPIAGWQEHYDRYAAFIKKKGRMSGQDADDMEGTYAQKMSLWEGSHDIGDILVHPSCAHIYRLSRFVQLGLMSKVVEGNMPDKVFYTLTVAP